MEHGQGLKKQTKQASHKGLKLSKKQITFLITLETCALNVSVTCQKCNVSRTLYETWTNTNDDFKLAVSHIEEAQVDFAETALKKKIQQGDTKAITYFLDNKGRHRGYGQKIDINNTHTHRPTELSHLSDEELAQLREDILAEAKGKKGKK